MSISRIFPRQDNGIGGDLDNPDDSGDLSSQDGSWWWSSDANAAKWGIIAAIFLLFFLLIVASYLHARSRLRKGLQPLAYHRWTIARRYRSGLHHDNPYGASGYRGQDVPMNHAAAPPPAYNSEEHHYTPAYSPPEDASKKKPTEHYAEIPPPGPPPIGLPPAHIGGGPSQRN